MHRLMISARGLTVVLGGKTVIDNVDLDIHEGKLTALIGRSGAGKSTLLRVLNRSVKFTGTYMFSENGHLQDASRMNVLDFRRNAVLVDQVPTAIPDTVDNNIRFVCDYWKIPCPTSRIDELLDTVDLDLDGAQRMDINSLSTGQLQRVHLARALALDPPLLLLDEPTSALDAINKENVERILRRLVDSGRTIVMVTHDLRQAERIADHCILLENGRKILDAPHGQFFKDIENETDADILRDLLEVD